LRMEDIQADLQKGRVSGVFPLRLKIRQTTLHASAAVNHRLLQGVETLQRPSPRRSTAIRSMRSQDPRHAVRFDAHQDRLAVEENLVEAARNHQTAAGLIQVIQYSACRLCR